MDQLHDPVHPHQVSRVAHIPYRFPKDHPEHHRLQELDVYIPPHLTSEVREWDGSKGEVNVPLKEGVPPAPVLLYIHGGAWMRGDKQYKHFYDVYSSFARLACANGYVTVMINYRLSPEVKFPAHNEDAVAALKWTRANVAKYGGDPECMLIAGNSAGGHIAASLTLHEDFSVHDEQEPAANAPWLKGVSLGSPVLDVARLHLAPLVAAVAKDKVFKWTGDKEYLEAISPITYVGEHVKNVKWFLVSAEDDFHLHFDILDLLRLLDDHGADVWYHMVPRTNHYTILGLGNSAGFAAPDFIHSFFAWAHDTVGDHPGLRVSPIVTHVPPPTPAIMPIRHLGGAIWKCWMLFMDYILHPIGVTIEYFFLHKGTQDWPKELRPSGIKTKEAAKQILHRRTQSNAHKWKKYPRAPKHKHL